MTAAADPVRSELTPSPRVSLRAGTGDPAFWTAVIGIGALAYLAGARKYFRAVIPGVK